MLAAPCSPPRSFPHFCPHIPAFFTAQQGATTCPACFEEPGPQLTSPSPKSCSQHTVGTAGLSCSICFLVGGTKSPQDITRVPRSPFLGSPCSLQPDGQGSRPLATPGSRWGLPKAWRGTAIPTSPASCWNMFLKPSSMSSSVISSCSQKGSSASKHNTPNPQGHLLPTAPGPKASAPAEGERWPLPHRPDLRRSPRPAPWGAQRGEKE